MMTPKNDKNQCPHNVTYFGEDYIIDGVRVFCQSTITHNDETYTIRDVSYCNYHLGQEYAVKNDDGDTKWFLFAKFDELKDHSLIYAEALYQHRERLLREIGRAALVVGSLERKLRGEIQILDKGVDPIAVLDGYRQLSGMLIETMLKQTEGGPE